MSATSSSMLPVSGPSGFPELVFMQESEQRTITLDHTPFTIGRKTDRDLIIADPRVSRDHASILSEGGDYVLVDMGSKHGTFVNGEKAERHKLNSNDRVEFGARGGPCIVFNPTAAGTSSAREFLSQISGIEVRGGASDLEKLTFFLEAARKLNTTGVVDEILVTLVDSTLRLTGAERGCVFLRDPDGRLRMTAGRNSKGEAMTDETTISRSILEEAARGASAFVVTDTAKSADVAQRKSIIAYDLRTVICIPLRKTKVKEKALDVTIMGGLPEIMGVLYLDSRFASRDLSKVSKDILTTIATEAASLVENARLVQAEEISRRYQQELSIAASIQQRLMAVTIPDLSYATIQARNLSCRDVGGDFFDVIPTSEGVAVVVTDVCGKGISAALLASILQGMVYSQIANRVLLPEVVTSINRFLCQKSLGEKYATLVIAHLKAGGELEFVNCGHVPPVLVASGSVSRMFEANVPVGLLPDMDYTSGRRQMNPGDRLVLITDGVTEAENPAGEFFGDERLETAAAGESPFRDILAAVRTFCAGRPFGDDCTVFELTYKG
ncbi:MAG: SpoIIE family protein phosphatase [Terriglobales bacterium]